MVPLQSAKRVTIKLGTGILTSGIGQLDTGRIEALCREVAALRAAGRQVIIVSSGAVGLGMGRLGLRQKPKRLASLQKCAAVGQSRLTETWQKAFDPHGIVVAQLLLTRDDVRSRTRHVALKELLAELLADGIVPIVNENDSISADEIKFGDNDVLSALVSSLVEADLLCILSTARGLENRAGDGEIIPVVESLTAEHRAMAGGTESPTGTGGMTTKLQAAEIATRSGCAVFIGSGRDPAIVARLFNGTAEGTLFLPSRMPMGSRKRWLAFFQAPGGTLHIDAGAVRALRESGGSLLAKGLLRAAGNFDAGDAVAIIGPDGQAVARGITRFASTDVPTIAGKPQNTLRESFPSMKRHEVVHRDSLVLL